MLNGGTALRRVLGGACRSFGGPGPGRAPGTAQGPTGEERACEDVGAPDAGRGPAPGALVGYGMPSSKMTKWAYQPEATAAVVKNTVRLGHFRRLIAAAGARRRGKTGSR